MGQDQKDRPHPRLPPLAGAFGERRSLAYCPRPRPADVVPAAEDAHDRRIAPGNLRAPPKSLAPQHRNSWQKPKRKVSVFRRGIDWLRRLMHKGRLWNRVWLLPEPWPKHKPNLEITCHAPP